MASIAFALDHIIKPIKLSLPLHLALLIFATTLTKLLYIATPVFFPYLAGAYISLIIINHVEFKKWMGLTFNVSAASIIFYLLVSYGFSPIEPRPSSLYQYTNSLGESFLFTEQSNLDTWQEEIFTGDIFLKKDTLFFGVEEDYTFKKINDVKINLMLPEVLFSETNDSIRINVRNNNFPAIYVNINEAESLKSITINNQIVKKGDLLKSIVDDLIQLRIWSCPEIEIVINGLNRKSKAIITGMNQGITLYSKPKPDFLMEAWPGHMTFTHIDEYLYKGGKQ